MVDMDTIEISNLNRQFLFRKHHVGESKAKIAADAVKCFCPEAEIITLQDNIKDSKFDIAYMKTFDIVLNGLDNLEARRHVNRLCLAANIPLVESGTTGYKGQVNVHLKDETACFECVSHGAPKGYPVCTIRNTPDKPIHCIVWAKEMLFARLFGPPDAVTDLDEGKAADPEGEAVEPAQSEYLRRDGEDAWAYAVRVFNKTFGEDIERVVGMEELWKDRKPPTPLHLDTLLPGLQRPSLAGINGTQSVAHTLGLGLRKVWSAAENAAVFLHALLAFHETRHADLGALVFDKNDDLAVDVVAAASNLRSACYGIPSQSAFDAKGMAGNIIHAIATTNALVSGLIVIEAVKVLAACRPAVRASFITGALPNQYGQWLSVHAPYPPNPSCMVCQQALVTLSVDTATFTLRRLVDDVLKRRLAFNAPTLMADGFLYEEGDDLDDDEAAESAALLPRALRDLPGGGLAHNVRANARDHTQDLQIAIVIHHKEIDLEEEPEGFVLEGAAVKPAEVQSSGAVPAAEGAGGSEAMARAGVNDDDSDIEVLAEHDAAALVVGQKRKASHVDRGEASSSKHTRSVPADVLDVDDDVVLVE